MSASRLFQILYLLLERGRMTAAQLAQELEVSVRTVYRDVDALSAAGIPIYTAKGFGGGVSLMDGYVLDRTAFTPDEQQLLLAVLQSFPDQEGQHTLSKLSALFHRREESWLRINLSRWGNGPQPDNGIFNRLRDAILSRHPVSFAYASSQGGIFNRQVLPARLVYRGQAWYLQAFDLAREDYRTFRLSRILELQVSEEVFHRKLEAPELNFSGEIPPLFRVEATLRFSPALAYRVYDEFSRDHITQEADGSLRVDVVFPQGPWLENYLLSFGAGVEVLAPDSLRQRLARTAENIWRTCRDTAPSS